MYTVEYYATAINDETIKFAVTLLELENDMLSKVEGIQTPDYLIYVT